MFNDALKENMDKISKLSFKEYNAAVILRPSLRPLPQVNHTESFSHGESEVEVQ